MKIALKQTAKGEFKLIRRKAIPGADGEMVPGPVVQETGWCRNKITLNAFNRMLDGTGAARSGCVVGAGNSTPDEEDEFLDSFIAGTSNAATSGHYNQYQTSTSPRYVRNVSSWLFGVGVAEGNVSEAGISMGGITSTHPLLCRSLVVDGNGDPTTVVVLDDEFLEVIWRITWYVPEDEADIAVLDNDGTPSNVTVTVRGSNMKSRSGSYNSDNRWGVVPSSYSFRLTTATVGGGNNATNMPVPYETDVLGSYDGQPVGTNQYDGGISVVNETYDEGSKTINGAINFALNRANFDTGIGALYFGFGYGSLQASFSPKIPKTSDQVATFDVVITLANAP